ncbi:MAG: hypothetical protein A3H93_10055 [Rhodocyclales bacterium RIFCSPLOWO2_02_FULL_63_24]|nr:MAG: hypothetical protein A3H93_10055 [Rhodocyclales bacterium RIFCSPLOWO2_02_FULL_63_24]
MWKQGQILHRTGIPQAKERRMELLEWNDSYSVGDALMDAHHQVFFRMVRQFSQSPERDSHDAMKKRIAFLAEYTTMHLGAEEKLMQQVSYPGLEQHRAVHQAFAKRVHAAKEAYIKNPGSIAADDILTIMQEWFADHILGEDKKYMPHVRQQA